MAEADHAAASLPGAARVAEGLRGVRADELRVAVPVADATRRGGAVARGAGPDLDFVAHVVVSSVGIEVCFLFRTNFYITFLRLCQEEMVRFSIKMAVFEQLDILQNMKSDTFIGNVPVLERLQDAVEHATLAHAYVFSGPSHVGKTTKVGRVARAHGHRANTRNMPPIESAGVLLNKTTPY